MLQSNKLGTATDLYKLGTTLIYLNRLFKI